MITIKINGITYKSLSKAGKAHNIAVPSIRWAIKHGNPTVKGLPFEVVKQPSLPLPLNSIPKTNKAEVEALDNQIAELKSRYEQAKIFGTEADWKEQLKEYRKVLVKKAAMQNPNHNSALPKPVAKPKKRSTIKGCPVYCETLNKTFKSITAAAKFAKADNWTMSIKMDVAGQFVDKEGNVYKRLKPMDTKNVYRNTGDAVQKIFKTKKSFSKQLNMIPVVNEVKVEKKVEVPNSITMIKEVLKENAMTFLSLDQYSQAKKNLDALASLENK